MAWSSIKPWLPTLYAALTMVVLPALLYSAIPVSSLRFAYYFVSGSYTFVACWVALETLVALFSTAFMSGHVHMELDIDQTRKWPEVCYIIPAYLNNEAGILDETMEQYLQLEYAGVINVMIVYNTRGPLPDEEAKLMNAWNGYHIGRMNFYVVNNPGCGSTRNLSLHRIGTASWPCVGSCMSGCKFFSQKCCELPRYSRVSCDAWQRACVCADVLC